MFHDLYYNGNTLRFRTGETIKGEFTSNDGFFALRDGSYKLDMNPINLKALAQASSQGFRGLVHGRLPKLDIKPNPLNARNPSTPLIPTDIGRAKTFNSLYLHSTFPVQNKHGIKLSHLSFDQLKSYAASRHKNTLTLEVRIGNRPKWIKTAWAEKGTKEIRGPKHNARVLEYSAGDGFPMSTDDNTHPWCGAFVGWVMRENGLPTPHISVRSAEWRVYGRKLKTPTYGCVGFKWRNIKKNLGHVTFIIGQNKKGDKIYGLGGNQDDAVNVMEFDKDIFDTFCVPTDYVNKHDWLPVYDGEYVESGRQG